MIRDVAARRGIPDARMLGEELSPRRDGERAARCSSSIRSTARRTSCTAIREYAVSIAALVDGVLWPESCSTCRRATCSPRRAAAARAANGAAASACRRSTEPSRALVGTGFPFKDVGAVARYLRAIRRRHARDGGHPPRRLGGARPVRRRVRPLRRVLGADARAVGLRRRILLVREAGGIVTDRAAAMPRRRDSSILAGNPAMHRWLARHVTHATRAGADPFTIVP